jgi:hypothetical protein
VCPNHRNNWTLVQLISLTDGRQLRDWRIRPMTWPQPTRQDHSKFCEIENWALVRDARGRTGTHHVTYELDLPEGRVLRTRISHPVDRDTHGPRLWSHILRDQLAVSGEEFWTCVRDGTRPDRGVPVPPLEALPADLVHLLKTRGGLAESEIAEMSKAEAVERLTRYWTEGGWAVFQEWPAIGLSKDSGWLDDPSSARNVQSIPFARYSNHGRPFMIGASGQEV